MKVFRFIALLAFLVLPCALFMTGQNVHAAEAKKANSIDELAKMYDSSSCKDCH